MLAAAGADAATARPGAADLCILHALQVERRAALPEGLLRAMALVESGRWQPERQVRRPWPWAIRAGRHSWYLPSRAAALDTIRSLQAKGVTSIDVGCMQINLHFHGDAFASPEDALDPAANVAYAAAYLSRLKDETGSWRQAAGYYHSRDPARSQRYLATVERQWRRARAPTEVAAGRPITRETVRELHALCDRAMAALARLRLALTRTPTQVAPPSAQAALNQ